MKQFDSIHIVLKVAEVCNLGCKYCYFYEAGDKSFQDDPAYLGVQTINRIGEFLARGVDDLSISTIDISLHGGEPLMMGKRRFEELIQILNRRISPKAHLKFVIQTNGTLVDDEWVRILSAYDVDIGISLDGPANVNDSERITKRGEGSYRDVVKGVAALRRGEEQGLVRGFGVGCVIHPDSSAAETYRHFADELGFTSMQFRPPMMDWTNRDPELVRKVCAYYADLMEAWLADNDPSVRLQFPSFVMAAMASDIGAYSSAKALRNRMRTFTIRSNGDLCPDDALVPRDKAYRFTGFNVDTCTLEEFFGASFWKEIDSPSDGSDPKCRQCRWLGICRGGPAEERYIGDLKFRSRTVFCEMRQVVFEAVYKVVSAAVGADVLDARLARAKDDDFVDNHRVDVSTSAFKDA